jgi:uncharacterized SAM-binding protein YcdF (DUF218 family)
LKRYFFGFLIILFAATAGVLLYTESNRILAQNVSAWTEDHRADCAVVLTGAPGRIREGFDLLVQGRVRKLLISGVYPQAELRDIFPQWPYYGPLNEEDVILEKRSNTTYGNAQQSLPLVEALRCRDVILITSRIHMYRAGRIFRAVFPSNYAIYLRATVAGRFQPEFPDLLLEATKSLFYHLWAY